MLRRKVAQGRTDALRGLRAEVYGLRAEYVQTAYGRYADNVRKVCEQGNEGVRKVCGLRAEGVQTSLYPR